MTEPHIEKAAEAVAREFGYELDDKFYDSSYWHRIAERALGAAFAELAANPPTGVIAAAATTLRNGHPHDGSDHDLAVDEDAAQALSAAFSALRKGDGDG